MADLHECGVCWKTYDPAEGDPTRAVAPGTAFEDLPDDWRCPECDAQKIKFLRTDSPRRTVRPRADAQAIAARAERMDAEGIGRALEAQMRRRAADGMAALPISNPKLRVEAVAFQQWRGWRLGVLVTPWSMLLIASPETPPAVAWVEGDEIEVAFPSGRYDLMPTRFEEIGPALMLPLFSPMDAFDGPPAAQAAAKAALLEIMTPPPARTLDRRALLRGEAAAEVRA